MRKPTTTLELHAYHATGIILDIIADLEVDGFLPLNKGDKVYLSEDGDHASVEQKTYSVPGNTVYVELSIILEDDVHLEQLLTELPASGWTARRELR